MTTREYVESLIRNTKKEQKEKKKKSFRKLNMYVVAGISTAVFGVVAMTMALPMGIAAFGTALAALSGYCSETKKQKMEQDAYDKEIEHLKKITADGIKVDTASAIARNDRYRRAMTNISGKEPHIDNTNKRDNITCGASVVTGLLGIGLGGVLGFISPLVAGYKYLTDRASNKDFQDYMNNKVELDNVSNELKIIRHAGTHRAPTRVTSSVLYPRRGNVRDNVREYTPEQMAAADKYINALANMNNEKRKPKQIVKK